MNNGDLVFAESDLEPGDTPFEDDIINGKNGKPYSGQDVVGIYPIKKGLHWSKGLRILIFSKDSANVTAIRNPMEKRVRLKISTKLNEKPASILMAMG